jgi:hypothetical protein
MSNRLSTTLSITALVVAVLGWTPIGDAAREAVFPPNSVGTEQLRTNAVTSAKIRNGSVTAIDIQKQAITAAHVRPGTLVASSFKSGQLPAGPKGDKGDKGDKGGKGGKGDPGLAGVSKYAIVEKTGSSTTASLGIQVNCPAGTRPVGGGGFTQTPAAGVHVRNSFPVTGTSPGWLVVLDATKPGTGWNYKAMAVCAAVAP